MTLNSIHFFDVYAVSPKSNQVTHPDSGMLGETLLMAVYQRESTLWFCLTFDEMDYKQKIEYRLNTWLDPGQVLVFGRNSSCIIILPDISSFTMKSEKSMGQELAF